MILASQSLCKPFPIFPIIHFTFYVLALFNLPPSLPSPSSPSFIFDTFPLSFDDLAFRNHPVQNCSSLLFSHALPSLLAFLFFFLFFLEILLFLSSFSSFTLSSLCLLFQFKSLLLGSTVNAWLRVCVWRDGVGYGHRKPPVLLCSPVYSRRASLWLTGRESSWISTNKQIILGSSQMKATALPKGFCLPHKTNVVTISIPKKHLKSILSKEHCSSLYV